MLHKSALSNEGVSYFPVRTEPIVVQRYINALALISSQVWDAKGFLSGQFWDVFATFKKRVSSVSVFVDLSLLASLSVIWNNKLQGLFCVIK